MITLDKSLRCLRHPVTLFCLGLLLLNDHVLKAAAPSWLMGKLSDVAGLFFFPFVLAALLGIVLDRPHVPSRVVGAAAFDLTVLWFALIKLCPWGNALTERLVTTLSGLPSAIALDPTDLLALPVLWPAWKLWDREEATTRRPIRWDLAFLGLASLASLATTCASQSTIDRVVAGEGVLYAHASVSGRVSQDQRNRLARSDDGGLTWIEIENAPSELDHEVTLPLVDCDPSDPSLCFRITGQEQVEESRNGSQMWQTAWQIPAGRRLYRRRLLSVNSCGQYGFDPEARDLTVLRKQDELYVAVAMGSEGVLVHKPDGSWTHIPILGTQPIPFSGDVVATWPELLSVFVVGILAALMLLGVASEVIFERVNRLPGWAMQPGKTAGIVITLLIAVTLLLGLSQISLLTWFACFVVALLGYGTTWRRIGDFCLRDRATLVLNGYNLLAVILIWLLGATPFVLWTQGTIHFYGIALTLALLAVGAFLVWSIRRVRQLARWAVTPPDTESV